MPRLARREERPQTGRSRAGDDEPGCDFRNPVEGEFRMRGEMLITLLITFFGCVSGVSEKYLSLHCKIKRDY